MNSNLYRLLAEYPLETLLQTIPTGLFLVDTDKTIVYWNTEAVRITGYTAEEAVGHHSSFLHGDPCHLECDLFSETTPKPNIGLTCTCQHKDGRTIALSKNVDLLRDKEGRIIGGIEAFVDISRLKELENSLRFAVEERTRELNRRRLVCGLFLMACLILLTSVMSIIGSILPIRQCWILLAKLVKSPAIRQYIKGIKCVMIVRCSRY